MNIICTLYGASTPVRINSVIRNTAAMPAVEDMKPMGLVQYFTDQGRLNLGGNDAFCVIGNVGGR